MASKKVTLVYIIILLIIFIPLAGIGIYYNTIGELPNNKTKEIEKKGYIYFYNNNEIESKYKCENENCKYATYTIDDSKYSLEYYKGEDIVSELINKRYAFIEDNIIKLYDKSSNTVVEEFQYIKNYGIGINNNVYLVKKNNSKWGIISLNNDYEVLVNFEYDYIGLYNKIDKDTNKLDSKLFSVLKDNKWSIISTSEILFESDYPITSYTDSYVSVLNNNEYFMYNYSNRLLNNLPLMYTGFIEDYSIVVNKDFQLYVKDIKNNKVLSEYIPLNITEFDIENKPFEITLLDNVLTIIINNGTEEPDTYTYNLV